MISSLGLLDLPPGEDRLARALENLARGLNPHLAFMDVLARGYAVIEARRDELLVTLRAVENVYQRPSPMRDLAVLRLVRGQETLEVTVPA